MADVEGLLRSYGTPRHHNKEDPLDELIFILLSAQTEEYTYLETYETLRAAFPGWADIATAAEETIAATIRAGGLYRKKSRQLKNLLARVIADAGRPTLDFLRELDDARAYEYLVSLPGVANKTARCVMLYALGRAVFPVDTHVWRVARRLGWTPQVPKPSDRQERELERTIPPNLRYSLHVNMVAHGRATCLTYWPKCGACVLRDICPSRDLPDATWGDWRQPGGAWARALEPTAPPKPSGSCADQSLPAASR